MPNGSQPTDTTSSLRRVRLAQIAIFSLVGAALVATAAYSYVSADRVYAAVALGQGQGLIQALRHSIGFRGPPSRSALERFVSANADLGLRCVSSLRPGGQVVQVGDCRMSEEDARAAVAEARPGEVIQLAGRIAIVDARPGPPPPRGIGHRPQPGVPAGREHGPPPGFGHGPPPGFEPGPPPRLAQGPPPGFEPGPPPEFEPPPGRGDGRRPPPRGPIVLEFEPVEANALRGAATTGLFTAFGAVAALLVAGLALARLSRRAEELQESAERQRQLASLGEMSAVLAHEIRNPLASLKGHAQLLAETLAPGGREHAKAERVVREATRLEELSEDLLSLVRSSRVEPVAVDPAAVVREAAQALGAERFAIDTSRAPRSWRLDAARMRQVLENLMRNALEASPPGAPVEVAVAADSGKLAIAVRDRGSGLADGDPSRIFEPFVTSRVRGTGLGLAVARRIVELHGGAIAARDREGGGAEFVVVLP
jgi:two-component system sensor histidine kinase HydH